MKECHKIKDLFGAYLHDDVTATERAALEKHIAVCEVCAADLKSRQKVMEKIVPQDQKFDMPQEMQDRFADNVYRRIALDTMKKRSRQISLQRFVLQPTFAVATLAVLLAIGVTQFRSGDNAGKQTELIADAGEAKQKELRARLVLSEFFAEEEIPIKSESSSLEAVNVSNIKQSLSNSSYRVQGALRRLENANFVNYSLGDRKRALAEYQQLVEDYPGTDVATEAQGQIKTILGTKVEYIGERRAVDMGI